MCSVNVPTRSRTDPSNIDDADDYVTNKLYIRVFFFHLKSLRLNDLIDEDQSLSIFGNDAVYKCNLIKFS